MLVVPPLIQIIAGDSMQIMKGFKEETFDLVVADPGNWVLVP